MLVGYIWIECIQLEQRKVLDSTIQVTFNFCLEKCFLVETHISEINFIAEPNVKIDGNVFHTIRIGYNGYLGGTNSQKDYRIIPILLMNYDLSADGGLVHYTEKFNKHYKLGFHQYRLISYLNDFKESRNLGNSK